MNNTNLLHQYGTTSKERVERALAALKDLKGILLVDNENRENEGDLIFPAETMSDKDMALMIRECSGIVCLCITAEKAAELGLRLMVEDNTSTYGTNFTVSIEAAEGVTTGVSAKDRVTTIRAAAAEGAKVSDLHTPGHIFPLIAREGGVFTRSGHTEGSIDIVRLAGFSANAILCELTNEDGTMSNLEEICAFANKHETTVVSIDDLIEYRKMIND